METRDVPVLIVGGGPVGLSAAILLSRFGVRSLLIERHPSITQHPKARGVFRRTMELFRQWGIEERVRPRGLAGDIGFIWAESLVGSEYGRVPPPPLTNNTPAQTCLVSQDVVEEELCAAARQQTDAELLFSTQLEFFEESESGIIATIRMPGGEQTKVRAAYMIAADGASSRVRGALGIGMDGPELGHQFNIYFRADLTQWFKDRECTGFFFTANAGSLLSVNGTDRWISIGGYRPDRGQGAQDFTSDFCVATVRRMLGLPDLTVEIINTAFWTMTAQVAESFAKRKVFLAGDAAHRFPPTGGFGMNSGVQDVHNLAWKLAAVIKGHASPALLESYECERRSIAQSNTDFSVVNARRMGALWGAAGAQDWSKMRELIVDQRRHLDNEGQDLGFWYRSPAVIPDGTEPPDHSPATYTPTARPGHRAPHLWLARRDERLSSLDLFDTRFVLLAGPAGTKWVEAAQGVAAQLGVPMNCFTIGPHRDVEDPDGRFLDLYGLDADGAVLVRPDGHVAWRARAAAAEPNVAIASALATVLGRAH